jgi:hypothetical protein
MQRKERKAYNRGITIKDSGKGCMMRMYAFIHEMG